MQLKVIKADGSIEEYLHTKVIAALSNVLAGIDGDSIFLAEQLADAVTYYLYHRVGQDTVSSSEIHEVIKAVLSATGYDWAAASLSEHHYLRKIRRNCLEVADLRITSYDDIKKIKNIRVNHLTEMWNKSIIVADLMNELGVDRHTARTIASMVEEQILSLGLNCVAKSMIKQFVLADTALILGAAEGFGEPDTGTVRLPCAGDFNRSAADREVRLGQQQEGLCEVQRV